MKSVVPFLKLYNTYMENFHKAIQMIDIWRGQNRIFGELLTEIEVINLNNECKYFCDFIWPQNSETTHQFFC